MYALASFFKGEQPSNEFTRFLIRELNCWGGKSFPAVLEDVPYRRQDRGQGSCWRSQASFVWSGL